MSVYTDNTVWHRASGESRYNLRSSNELSMSSSSSGIYGRHKGSGKSKATVIRRTSNFALYRRCDVLGGRGGGVPS